MISISVLWQLMTNSMKGCEKHGGTLLAITSMLRNEYSYIDVTKKFKYSYIDVINEYS
jgi:hypothetical protein